MVQGEIQTITVLWGNTFFLTGIKNDRNDPLCYQKIDNLKVFFKLVSFSNIIFKGVI